MARAAKAIKPILGLVPPDPSSLSLRDMMGLLKVGQYAKSLSEKELYQIAKLLTMSAADLLNDWFEFDPLKGTKSASGIIGTFLGPHSPGTAYVLLAPLHGRNRRRVPRVGFREEWQRWRVGGDREFRARAGRGSAHKASVQQGDRAGRAAPRASALANGDELRAKVVISAATPSAASCSSSSASTCPGEFVQQIENFRVRGFVGKVNIALSELPDFTCLSRAKPAASRRDFDQPEHGSTSSAPTTRPSTASSPRTPYIDMIIPSMIDRDMAPPGHHVMSCFVQYAPYDIEGGWDDAKREAFGETVISTIERYAPNIRRAIVGKQVITPKDIEMIAGITGGNIFHGELLLHQLFFLRPAPQWADFRTPLPAITSARPARIRAVASWARPASWPHRKS
jgi:phytoene dehydrogenase-like protein